MERKILPYLVALSAISVSLSAAFYSVTGLSAMFAGAATQVAIMAGSLEIAKLVIASLLYQYWDKLNFLLKTYLTIAVGILMIITSGGIYGYLSGAYSEVSNKLEVINKNVAVYDLKRERFQIQLNDVTTEKQSLTESILELTKGLSNNVIQYKDKDGNIITTTSGATRNALEKQLDDAKQQRDKLSIREETLTDSITKIDLNKLELETNTDIASELGPLKYIANITGKTMDQVVNWFIIALMIVFDPLAIALVISANVVFSPDPTFIKPKEEDDFLSEDEKETDILLPPLENKDEIVQNITSTPQIQTIAGVNNVLSLIKYLENNTSFLTQYRIDNNYRIPIHILNKLGFNQEMLDYIRNNTKPFEGRIIMEDDICIIEHP
jgi:hypothetical protein